MRKYKKSDKILCEAMSMYDKDKSNFPTRAVPPVVVSRAKSAGNAGEEWLAGLDDMIRELEIQWSVTVGEALTGGSHAFVAPADGVNGEKYVIKIDMPENLGGESENEAAVLRAADGHGYARLYSHDSKRKALLLERLGNPLNRTGIPVFGQLKIICSALNESWKIVPSGVSLPGGVESVEWFRGFIGEEWESLSQPCPRKVIDRAFSYLSSREEKINPGGFVLLHGDAHGGNTLKVPDGEGYRLIDPDGIVYEKEYDLGVLMREWIREYEKEPLSNAAARCEYLGSLTGGDKKGIWEWGYLQTVSTAFVLLKTGRAELGRKMLDVAESWTSVGSNAFNT